MQRLTFVIFLAALLYGCGTYKESLQVEDQAYLLLIGDRVGIVVELDDLEPIKLSTETRPFNLEGKQATKIRIEPGTHLLKISKNGETIVNKRFYVSSGNSFEVQM